MTPFKEISVEAARKLLGAGVATFVDVRDRVTYETAHVPGAVPLNSTNVQDFIAQADKSRAVVVYCYHGITSQTAAAYLAAQGFGEVYSVIGGFERWRQTERIELSGSGRH